MVSGLFLEMYMPAPFLSSPPMGWQEGAVTGAGAAILDHVLKTSPAVRGEGGRRERPGCPSLLASILVMAVSST